MKGLARVAVFLAVILAVTLFMVGGQGYAQDKDKAIRLKFCHHFPVGHGQAVLCQEWAKDLEKRTKGRIKVIVYPGSSLAPPQQIYDATKTGIIDVGNFVASYTPGRFPLLEGIDLPFGYPSGLAATKMVNAFYQKFKPKELDEVKVLWLHAVAPYILHTKRKAVYNLEDLKGLKIRTTGTSTRFASSLGAIPIAMPMNDVYDSLSKGVVEGLMACYEVMEGHALADQIEYSTENYGSAFTVLFMMTMNKNKWNSLPKDIQAIIDEMSAEYIVKTGKVWDDIDRKGKELIVKRGNKIISLSPQEQTRWAEKAKPVIDEYVKNMKAKNLPGEEAVRFINDYLKPYRR